MPLFPLTYIFSRNLIRRLQTRLCRNPRLRVPDGRIHAHLILQLDTHRKRAVLRQRSQRAAAERETREYGAELFFEIHHGHSGVVVWRFLLSRFTFVAGFFELGEGFGGGDGGEGGDVEEEALERGGCGGEDDYGDAGDGALLIFVSNRERRCSLLSGIVGSVYEGRGLDGTYLEQFRLDGGDGILDPFADFGVSVLSNRVVVFPRAEERGGGVDVALVEDGVDGDGEEVAEGGDDGLVGV